MKRLGFFDRLLGRGADDGGFAELNIDEKDMIRGVVQLSETTVKEVLVPRIDTVFVASDISLGDLIRTLTDCGHSRVPVYKETIDEVVGILYAKDLLRLIPKSDGFQLMDIIRKPYFVPETMRLDALLGEFKRRKVHIAVAVDEYGGVSGIVCLEDVIEEIVGDIQDEFDHEPEEMLEVGKGTYLCDARADIEEINEKLELELPDDDFDTLGGFVFELFRKIPVRYEKVSYRGIDFIIQEMHGHKIKTIKMVLPANETT